jgi:uncharacterized protein
MRIAAIHRYPVKGLSPERLNRVVLEQDSHFPGDRMFAIENGPSGFDPADPRHQPKIKFLMLMRNEALARLSTRYDDAGGVLTISDSAGASVSGDLATEQGRAAITRFLEGWMPADDLRGPLKLLAAPSRFRFTDTLSGHISLINLASVVALEERLGAPVNPLRFRGNLHIEGLKPWEEFSLIGKTFEGPGGVRLTITERIDRCAATSVDPDTGVRDLPVVKALMSAYGHIDCGVFARVTHGGALSEGARLAEVEAASVESLGLR